jgi:hypothetical protein
MPKKRSISTVLNNMEGLKMDLQSINNNGESFYQECIETMKVFSLFLGTPAGFRVLVNWI